MTDEFRCRVATWNIHSGVGRDGVFDAPRVAAVLAALDADIIGLQEVDWRHPMSGPLEMLDYLGEQLGMHAVEGPNLHDHRGRYGNGLLTRFEVVEHRLHSLAYAGREPRGAIEAVLDGKGVRVRVLVTHLGLRVRERRAQVSTLRTLAASEEEAEVSMLLGDMNEWASRRLMRRAFTPEPYATMCTGRTFPSKAPIFPLDCLFLNPAPLALKSSVVRSRDARVASDHLPLVADCSWQMGLE